MWFKKKKRIKKEDLLIQIRRIKDAIDYSEEKIGLFGCYTSYKSDKLEELGDKIDAIYKHLGLEYFNEICKHNVVKPIKKKGKK